jgi:hypothetical protein
MQKQFVLKARETVKRVAAITAGATLLGATAMGAVAAGDLGDYPAPFVTDGMLVGKIVLGSTAVSADTAGAVNIMSTLSQAAVTVVAGTGTTTVTGGSAQEIPITEGLGDSSHFGPNGVDSDELDSLYDGTISIDIDSDETYDVHEEIVFSSATIHTGLTRSSPDEDFKTDTYLDLSRGAIEYRFVFDDDLDDDNLLANASTADTISISLLGHDLDIVGATADTITVSTATEYYMKVGGNVVVDGKSVTLVEVGTDKVVVDVDGTTRTVGSTSESINGLKIQADDTFAKDAAGEGSATLKISENDITKKYSDGDYFIGEDKDDPNWVWELGGLDSITPSINVTWDRVVDNFDDEGYITVENGETITFPNNYAELYLNKYTITSRMEYRVSIEESARLFAADGTTELADDVDVLHFEAVNDGNNGFDIDGTSTDDIYVWYNSTSTTTLAFFQQDHNNANRITNVLDRTLSNTTAAGDEVFNITYKDSTIEVSVTKTSNPTLPLNNTLTWNIEEGLGQDFSINVSVDPTGQDFGWIGSVSGDTAYAEDVMYGVTDISNWDEDTRTEGGMIISSYEGTRSSDKVAFSVPGDVSEYDVDVIIAGVGTATSTTGGVTEQADLSGINSVTFDDVVDKTSGHLILIGGPAVNRLTAEALGLEFPTSGMASTIPENKAILKWIDNAFGGSNTVLIVAGWEAGQTQAAASVLRAYSTYASDLDGKTSVVVDGTTVTAVGADTTTE